LQSKRSGEFERAFVGGYDGLVRVAYLALLSAGPMTEDGRALAVRRAHGIVYRTLVVRTLTSRRRGDGVSYQAWRRRVLRRVLKAGRVEGRRGWRTVAPERPTPEAGRLLEVLGRLTPTQAVQYGLRMAENLGAEETATELDAVGVTVADDVVAKVEERTGLPEADQRALLAERAFDPTVLHIRPTGVPWSIRVLRRRLRLLAGAMALAVATAGVVWLVSPASPGQDDLDTNSTSETASDVTEWPLRGNLRGDEKLLNRAVAYWNSPDAVMWVNPPYWSGRPASTPTVVFAGDVLGHRVVVMADDHAIVRYSEDPDQARRLYVNAYEPEHGELDARGLIQLADYPGERDEQTPYLVPPGVTQVLVADLGNSRPAWQRVPVHDGIAAGWPPAQPDPEAGCSMLMFALTRPTKDGTTRTDTYSDAGATLVTAPVDFQPDNGRPRPAAVPPLSAQSVGLLRAVRCLAPKPGDRAPGSIVGDLSGGLLKVEVDQFWQGRLPETSAHVAFAAVTLTTTNGQDEDVSTHTLLAPDDPRYLNDTLPYAGREHLRSDTVGTVYSTHWWKAPSGRWYLIVGGSPDVTRIRIWGQIDQSARGNTFILRGPKSKKAPSTVVAALDKHSIPARLL
jgi:hypothetical protein